MPTRPRSLRREGYDYTRAGAYFVTICLDPRLPLFGEVHDDFVELSELGELVARTLQSLPERFEHVAVDVSMIMPDHVHAIVVLDSADRPGRAGVPSIVGAFKSLTTRRANELRGRPGAQLWQRGFFDHVVRDGDDLDRVRQYVQTNPKRWSISRQSVR